MAAYLPTDCPTREKHGWLGDAQVTAEEAAYNLWAPTVHALFLDLVRDQQVPPQEPRHESLTDAQLCFNASAAACGATASVGLPPAAAAASDVGLETLAPSDTPSATSYAGFVPGVVSGAVQRPGDLSWTAAYPLIARWLLLYHGALHLVAQHWLSLKSWADGAAR
eukprot:522949-Prymnesium_polylepis.1